MPEGMNGVILKWAAFVPLLVCPCLADDAAPVVVSVDVPETGLAVKLATQVGRPYDAAAVDKDVRYLWGLGRFDDVRVETSRAANGVAVVFQVKVAPHLLLHEIRIEPNTFGLELKVPEGTPIDALRAHQIAMDAQRQLHQEGYQNARVNLALKPLGHGNTDLKLTVDIGKATRVKEVRFEGDSSLKGDLEALKTRRMTPPVPFLWSGWRLLPSYSPEAVDSDVEHLRSVYAGRGYFDAEVRPGDVEIQGKDARVTIVAQPGKRYPLDPEVCTSLLAERREAQRQGVLDFSARLNAEHLDEAPAVQLGPRYRVAKIEFRGNHRYSDSAIRRNFLLDEGAIFDEHLLRLSIARLNRGMWFENIDSKHVVVQPDEKTGLADVTVWLTEHKSGRWRLSGPVGPLSVGGPVEASISSRLPPWGRGLLELSTYAIAAGFFVYGKPLLPILNAPKPFTPVLMLTRPFTPGGGWLSGFTIAPQLGWPETAISYGTAQIQQRLLPLMGDDRSVTPDLKVTVGRPEGEVTMSCQPPKPRLVPLRYAATIALRMLGTVPAI
jgi:outer membrane protein insertion porin family